MYIYNALTTVLMSQKTAPHHTPLYSVVPTVLLPLFNVWALEGLGGDDIDVMFGAKHSAVNQGNLYVSFMTSGTSTVKIK